MTDSLANRLEAMRDELHARLYASSAEYRELHVLDQAISMARSAHGDIKPANLTVVTRAQNRSLSQADAAVAVLEETGEPQTLADMLDLVTAKGVVIKGKRRDINLSSTLSRDDRLQSIYWGGFRKWWFADRPVPGPDLLNEKAADVAPSENAPAAFQMSEGR